jgi:hypothetical protein
LPETSPGIYRVVSIKNYLHKNCKYFAAGRNMYLQLIVCVQARWSIFAKGDLIFYTRTTRCFCWKNCLYRKNIFPQII